MIQYRPASSPQTHVTSRLQEELVRKGELQISRPSPAGAGRVVPETATPHLASVRNPIVGDDEVLARIRRAAEETGVGDLSRRAGISRALMSMVVAGKREPNDAILTAIGLKRAIVEADAVPENQAGGAVG